MKNRVPNEWTKLEYFDPKVVLPNLREIREQVSMTDTPEKIASLRTSVLKSERESWDAAIFSQLLSLTIGKKIFFSRYQDSDFDSIFTWDDNGTQCYAAIQLKELVPEHTNATATLNDILMKLNKYSGHNDLIVGIKLNRRESFDFMSLNIKNLQISELWMFGLTSESQNNWSLFGEFLSGEPRQYEYNLPYI